MCEKACPITGQAFDYQAPRERNQGFSRKRSDKTWFLAYFPLDKPRFFVYNMHITHLTG